MKPLRKKNVEIMKRYRMITPLRFRAPSGYHQPLNVQNASYPIQFPPKNMHYKFAAQSSFAQPNPQYPYPRPDLFNVLQSSREWTLFQGSNNIR